PSQRDAFRAPVSSLTDTEAPEDFVEDILDIYFADELFESAGRGTQVNGCDGRRERFSSPRPAECFQLTERALDREAMPRLGEHRRVEVRRAEAARKHAADCLDQRSNADAGFRTRFRAVGRVKGGGNLGE